MVTDLDLAIEAIDEAIDHLSETEALYAGEEPGESECEIVVSARSGLLTILEHLDTLVEAKHAEKLDRWRRQGG